MSPQILIVHAPTEEHRAEELAVPLREAGYEVAHQGTMLVGSSVIAEASKALENQSPVVVCGTIKAIGMGWARKVVQAARAVEVRVFIVQMEEYADVHSLAFGEQFARYWQNPAKAAKELLAALQRYYPAPEGVPARRDTITRAPSAEHDQELLDDYLSALIAEVRLLRPGRIRKFNLPLELVLDDIYVELRAEPDRPTVDRRVTLEELREARIRVENWSWEDPQERERQYRIFADLDRSFKEGHAPTGPAEDLTAIIQRYQRLVILGDPGSGKTTLLRHLALQSAKAMLETAGAADAGPVRVPIYIRVSEYAEFRARTDPDLTLADYLPRYIAGLQGRPSPDTAALLRRLLEQGRCIVLLDGLDEVIEDRDRRKVATAIGQFAAALKIKRRGSPDARLENEFVVTSRIAGYRPFVELPSSFAHYTIQSMTGQQIENFLDRWCKAVEQRLQDGADIQEIEQRALQEKELILQAIAGSPGVRRLAENPLLLRILAMLHRSEGRLPQRRVKLYEEATSMLLHDWHLERLSPKGVAIDESVALSLLGPIAMYIHTRQPSGFLSPKQSESLLCRVRGAQLGDPPDDPSVETIEGVKKFLRTVREHSGLFVERGTGLFGFMHLTFQEYFVARHLISHRDSAIDEIRTRLHQPRWREPILLAIASINEIFRGDIDEILVSILEAGSEFEEVLHRDLLFAAECIGDCVNVYPLRRQDIARRLIATYCDPGGAGRYSLLRAQIKNALQILSDSTDSWAVDLALAEAITGSVDQYPLSRLTEIAEWVHAKTQPVINALQSIPAQNLLPDVRQALRHAQVRALAEPGYPADQSGHSLGWQEYSADPILARAVGALWLYGSRDLIELGLGVPDEALRGDDRGDSDIWAVIARLRQASWHLETCGTEPLEDLAGIASELAGVGQDLNSVLDADSSWHDAANLLIKARDWYGNASRLASSRVLAYALKNIAIKAASFFIDGVQQSKEQLAGELLSVVTVLMCGHDLTQGQAAQFRAKARLLAQHSSLTDLSAQLLALESARPCCQEDPGNEAAGSRDSARQAFQAKLVAICQELQHVLGEQQDERLTHWGRTILSRAQFCNSLAAPLVEMIREAMPLRPVAKSSEWHAICTATARAVVDAAVKLLQETADPQVYLEAAFLIARTGHVASDVMTLRSRVITDLEGSDRHRQLLALTALRDPAIRYRVGFGHDRRSGLIALAGSDQLATAALEVLFDLNLAPELLSWCWAVLREGSSSLARKVEAKLEDVATLEGTTPFLDLLDEGLGHEATRPASRGLLKKLKWAGPETYSRCLIWLSSQDPQARGVAAMMLAQDDRLFRVPEDVLQDAIRTAADAELDPVLIDWAMLRNSPEALRLLHTLWIHGWHDALAILWTGEPAGAHLDTRGLTSALNSEKIILWFLERAQYGQALIPVVTRAARRLAELEGARAARTPIPHNHDVISIQQVLLDELERLAGDGSEAHTPVEFDASILKAALWGEPPSPPSPQALWRIQRKAGGLDDWYWSAARLAGMPAELAKLRGILNAALSSADKQRRAAAVLLLQQNPSAQRASIGTEVNHLENPDMRGVLGLFHVDILSATSQHPISPELTANLRQVLSGQRVNLQGEASVAELAQNLQASADPRTRAAAAGLLLCHDLYVTLVSALTHAAFSTDDQLRWEAEQHLYRLCQGMRTDGSTAAVEWLYQEYYRLFHGRPAEGQGREGTVMVGAVSEIHHTSQYWISKWMDVVNDSQSSEDERRSARGTLAAVTRVSPEVESWICAQMTSAASVSVRQSAADALVAISNYSGANSTVVAAFIAALDDEEIDVRRAAAYGVQWALEYDQKVNEALLRSAGIDSDVQVRILSLISLGRFLRRTGDFQDIEREPVFEKLVALLAAAEPAVGRAAATGIASAVQNLDRSFNLLSSLLPDSFAVLTATLNGAGDVDYWNDGGPAGPSHHVAITHRIALWLYEQPARERLQLVELVLANLERAAEGMEESNHADDDEPRDPAWAFRRIATAVLAELSDRLTYRSFAPARPLADVVSVFARLARDPDSYNARRFSLRVLGNLQQFTPDVAMAFFEACRDVSPVYDECRPIIRKFKYFAPGSLQRLTAALFDSDNDASIAGHAATLLGELGISRSEELGQSSRRVIAGELSRFLASPLANRKIVELSPGHTGIVRELGSLCDPVYEALVRVMAGPDAPESETVSGETAPARDDVWLRDRDTPLSEFQDILSQFEEDTLSGAEEMDFARIAIIWLPAEDGDSYCVSLHGSRQWGRIISHDVEGEAMRLVIRPLRSQLPLYYGAVVIGPSSLHDSRYPDHGFDAGVLLDEPGAKLLREIPMRVDDIAVNISVAGFAGPSAVQHGRADGDASLQTVLPLAHGLRLNSEDIVIGGGKDLYVSFPYWEGHIEKVSYTLEDGYINIIVLPSEEGLRLRGKDVVFSRDGALLALPASHIARLRRRQARRNVSLRVSIPYREGMLEKVSYTLEDTYLNIILKAAEVPLEFRPEEVLISMPRDADG